LDARTVDIFALNIQVFGLMEVSGSCLDASDLLQGMFGYSLARFGGLRIEGGHVGSVSGSLSGSSISSGSSGIGGGGVGAAIGSILLSTLEGLNSTRNHFLHSLGFRIHRSRLFLHSLGFRIHTRSGFLVLRICRSRLFREVARRFHPICPPLSTSGGLRK